MQEDSRSEATPAICPDCQNSGIVLPCPPVRDFPIYTACSCGRPMNAGFLYATILLGVVAATLLLLVLLVSP